MNWEKLFGEEGVRWFHTGGIFAALAPNTSEAVIEAVEAARKYGTDRLLRPQLPRHRCGRARAARKARRRSTATSRKYVDVMIGNEEDFTACLGFEVEGLDEHISAIDPANFKKMIADRGEAVPQLQGRGHHAAQRQDRERSTTGRAILYAGGEFYQSMMRENLEIYDRVGGGDGFASRPGLRLPRRQGAAGGGGIRRGARRAGHDHAGRHLDGATSRKSKP